MFPISKIQFVAAPFDNEIIHKRGPSNSDSAADFAANLDSWLNGIPVALRCPENRRGHSQLRRRGILLHEHPPSP
jgi:hypothetical protein